MRGNGVKKISRRLTNFWRMIMHNLKIHVKNFTDAKKVKTRIKGKDPF